MGGPSQDSTLSLTDPASVPAVPVIMQVTEVAANVVAVVPPIEQASRGVGEAPGTSTRERSRSPPPGTDSVERWCNRVLEDWKRLEHAPPECRSDPELVCEATRLSAGEALRFAAEELRGDREFVLGATEEIGPAVLEHASAELRADRSFALEV